MYHTRGRVNGREKEPPLQYLATGEGQEDNGFGKDILAV